MLKKHSFFDGVLSYCEKSGIEDLIKNSPCIIVGFSGGADSTVLLSFLLHCKERYNNIKLVAAHVNHMIRGEEAERDCRFCEDFCKEKGVVFECLRADVPAIAKKEGLGLEEAARNIRYGFFEDLRKKHDGALIATAHNADDNMETVIFNMARGTGTKGICGIAPVRDGIYIRPLLSSTSAEIRNFANENGIDYVTDSTNASTDYTRNAIRHGIAPKIFELNPRAQKAFLRLSDAAREDCDYLESEADRLISDREITREFMNSLHPALFHRVLRKLYKNACGSFADLSNKNIADCKKLLEGKENGSVSLPHSLAFFAQKEKVFIAEDPRVEKEYSIPAPERTAIKKETPQIFGRFIIYCTENEDYINTIEENIYNLSLHDTFDCGKITGELFARCRKAGDAFRFRKMNRKLKKLLCDCRVPTDVRDRLPIIEDSDGILYVPFVGKRDGTAPAKESKKLYIHIYEWSQHEQD